MERDQYWSQFWQRRASRRRVLQGAALGGAGLAAAAVIGCDEGEEGPPATTAPGGGTPAAEQPRRGGTILSYTTIAHAPTLDMHKSSFAQPSGHGVYGRLVRHDLDKYPNEISFIGDIAESWEVPDPATWVFKIRQGVKYQNIPPVNGRTVKAADIIYSYERQRNERINAGTVRAISKAEAADDFTLRITLTQPDADLLWSLSDSRSVIIPRESVEAAGGDLQSGPIIGTGAWIWDQSGYVQNQVSKLKRNPDFHIKGADGQSLPYADGQEQVVINDANLIVAAFRAGQIDIHSDSNKQTADLLRQTVPDLYVLDAKLLNQTGDRLWMDATVAPYTDQRVRQALGKLFNRVDILNNAFFGSGWVNPMMFVPSLDWILPQSEFDNLVGYNPQQARQLLQAAGVDLASFKPTIPSGANFQRNIAISEILAAEMKKIGISAELQPIVSQEVIDVFTTAKAPISLLNDPAPRGTNLHLFNYFHSSGGLATYWKKLADREFDRLIEAQATILEPERRKAALLETVRRGLTLAVAVPSVGQTGEYAFRPRVAGMKHNTSEPHRWAYTWLKA